MIALLILLWHLIAPESLPDSLAEKRDLWRKFLLVLSQSQSRGGRRTWGSLVGSFDLPLIRCAVRQLFEPRTKPLSHCSEQRGVSCTTRGLTESTRIIIALRGNWDVTRAIIFLHSCSCSGFRTVVVSKGERTEEFQLFNLTEPMGSKVYCRGFFGEEITFVLVLSFSNGIEKRRPMSIYTFICFTFWFSSLKPGHNAKCWLGVHQIEGCDRRSSCDQPLTLTLLLPN